MCDERTPNGNGTTTYSGWITTFCFWDEQGRCQHNSNNVELTRSQIPMGFTKVPVRLYNYKGAIRTDMEMLAGSVAIRAGSSNDQKVEDEPSNGSRGVLDTIPLEGGWFIYKQ